MMRMLKKHSAGIAAFLLFCTFFAGHLWLVNPIIGNGDNAQYLQLIDEARFDTITTHWGYFVLGVAWNWLAPFSTAFNLNLMCLLFGALGVVAGFWIVYRYTRSVWYSVIPAVIAMSMHSYVRGSLMAEVDIVAISLTLMALAAFVHRRAGLAGLLFGVGMTVSPLTSLSLPFFLFLFPRNAGETVWKTIGRYIRRLMVMGMSAIAVWGPVVAYHYQNYVHGRRGLLKASRLPFDLTAHLERSFSCVEKECWLLMPLLAGSLLVMLFSRRKDSNGNLAWGILFSAIATIAFGERFDDIAVQLPNFIMAGVVAAIVIYRVGQQQQVLVAVLVIAAMVPMVSGYRSVMDETDKKMERRELYLAMKEASAPRGIQVVGLHHYWNDINTFEYTVYGKTRIDKGHILKWFKSGMMPILKRTKAEDEIWFLSRFRQRDFDSIMDKYEWTTRKVLGRRYRVLTPKKRKKKAREKKTVQKKDLREKVRSEVLKSRKSTKENTRNN